MKTILALAITLVISSCKIQPISWEPPIKPDFKGIYATNEELLNSTKISLLNYFGAEDFAVNSMGIIYSGVHKEKRDFSSGAILKIHPNDSVEEFIKTNGWVTGIEFDNQDNLIGLLQGVGLIKIHPNKSIDTLLTKTPDGLPILMGTGLEISSSGLVYFANMSSTNTSSNKYINKLILEMKPTGGVYCFNPKTKETITISKGNYFGNGLALSPNEDFLLLSETSKYRILKYWLKGTKKGQSEVFMNNLPGFPNNINKSSNGNFWIGFTTKRNDQLDIIHSKPGMKKFVYALPSFIQPKPEEFGMVVEVNSNGQSQQRSLKSSRAKLPSQGKNDQSLLTLSYKIRI